MLPNVNNFVNEALFFHHLGVPAGYRRRALRCKSSPITAVGFPLQSLTHYNHHCFVFSFEILLKFRHQNTDMILNYKPIVHAQHIS